MRIRSLLFSLLIVGSFTLFSCENEDDSNNNNQTSADLTIEIAQVGTWRITSFIDSGEDETSDFNGYNFTFNSDGTLVATNGSNTQNGTWSVTNESSSSDDDFNIFFSVPETNDFEDLNDDWDIVSVSATVISLIDVSGGNGETDTLIFTQN